MSKSVQAFLGVIVGVGALVGVASSAEAHHRHCSGCASPPPKYVYHDVYRSSEVYHHTNKYHRYPVDVLHVTVHVTRLHHVVHVHNHTTIHEQPYAHYVYVSKQKYETEPTTYTYSSSTSVVHEPCRSY